jgi:acyl-CoA reductase-like NAD-dependent aldehyde dehydrogenase
LGTAKVWRSTTGHNVKEILVKSINPHQPSDIIGEFEETGQGGVEEAVARAREAFLEWSEQPAANRGGALAQMADETEERAEELAQLAVREVGKPIGEARAELSRAVAILRYYAPVSYTI